MNAAERESYVADERRRIGIASLTAMVAVIALAWTQPAGWVWIGLAIGVALGLYQAAELRASWRRFGRPPIAGALEAPFPGSVRAGVVKAAVAGALSAATRAMFT